MIVGIGRDIIDIRRVEKKMERKGRSFRERVFKEIEKRK